MPAMPPPMIAISGSLVSGIFRALISLLQPKRDARIRLAGRRCIMKRLDRRLTAQPPDILERPAGLSSEKLGQDMTADASLATTHARPREDLQTIDVAGLKRADGGAHLAEGHILAAAQDRLIRRVG